MSPLEEVVSDLVRLADVPREQRSEARRWLSMALAPVGNIGKSRARAHYDAVADKPLASAHNKPLQRVLAASCKMKDALEALRSHPAFIDFWLDDGLRSILGPISNGDFERGVVDLCKAIEVAAVATQRKGRKNSHGEFGKQRMADTSKCFLRRFRPDLPPGGVKANDFAQVFYQIVAETTEGLGKQMKQSRKRTGHKSVKN